MADVAKNAAKGPGSPTSKKKKKSKSVKDRKKKEEQEKKAFEEEQARLRADAKLEKIREAEEQIIRAKQENEERKVRRKEMSELQEILLRNETLLKELNHELREQSQWARYMRCDGIPDPLNQREINTYVNLCLEDISQNNAVNVLKDSRVDLMLIEEIKSIMQEMPSEEFSDKEKCLRLQTIKKLEQLILTKLDLATVQLLCDTTDVAGSDSGDLQTVIKNEDIALCVWGNVKKAQRKKIVEFSEIHFTFEIPKVLALNDCAVRVLTIKYDFYSPTSSASKPRIKQKEPEIKSVQAEIDEEKKEGLENADVKTDNGTEDKVEDADKDLIDSLEQPPSSEGTEEQKQEREAEDVVEEDYPDCPTPELPEWEDFDEADDIIDLRAFEALGGVFKFNLLQLLPQPKVVGSWTITQLIDPPEVIPLEYVADTPPPPPPDGNKENKKDDKLEKLPISVNMLLPEDVAFFDQPQVARWDENRKFWTTHGFSDLTYNEEARTFGFKTCQFGTFCLLQDSYINMPFQSWEIRPRRINHAVLSVTAAIVDVQIEIKDALCCLSQPMDKPELKSFRNMWVTPAQLITRMKTAGINIFPSEDSSRFVSIQNKHPLAEDYMYKQMALTASAMAYAWSKWNGDRGREEVIFQGTEVTEDGPLIEEEWALFLATKRRVQKLKMTEYDEVFREALPEDARYTSTLYHLLADIASEAALAKIQETDFQFVDCVYQLLKATKVLTYS